MRISKDIVTRLEGEVELKLFWKDGVIYDAYIVAPTYRGFENLLVGRSALDTLVITPRVCGICGHAHLIATVKALENLLENQGYEIDISNKAERIRKITLALEIIQNHLRWFYIYLLPDFCNLKKSLEYKYAPFKGVQWQKGLKASNTAIKALSILAGQWPHNSYAIPGGVTCDPTVTELTHVESLIDRLIRFFEEEIAGVDIDTYMSSSGFDILSSAGGDLRELIDTGLKYGLDRIGRSYGHLLTGGTIEPCITSGVKRKKVCKFDVNYVHEKTTHTFSQTEANSKAYSWSKTARYRGEPFETGPLARQVLSDNPRIRQLYRQFKDATLVRIIARVDEIALLLLNIKSLLKGIDLREPSATKLWKHVKQADGFGIGIVEASRGTLIHKLSLDKGKVLSYDIITPTVWNLGPRDDVYLGVAEKALIGIDSKIKAYITLRSFDACSVCTTH